MPCKHLAVRGLVSGGGAIDAYYVDSKASLKLQVEPGSDQLIRLNCQHCGVFFYDPVAGTFRCKEVVRCRCDICNCWKRSYWV